MQDILLSDSSFFSVFDKIKSDRKCVDYSFVWETSTHLLNNRFKKGTSVATYAGSVFRWNAGDDAKNISITHTKITKKVPFQLASMCIQYIVTILTIISTHPDFSVQVVQGQLKRLDAVVALTLNSVWTVNNPCTPSDIVPVPWGKQHAAATRDRRMQGTQGIGTQAVGSQAVGIGVVGSKITRGTQADDYSQVTGTQTDQQQQQAYTGKGTQAGDMPPMVMKTPASLITWNPAPSILADLVVNAMQLIKDVVIPCITDVLDYHTIETIENLIVSQSQATTDKNNRALAVLGHVCNLLYARVAPLRDIQHESIVLSESSSLQVEHLFNICVMPEFVLDDTDGKKNPLRPMMKVIHEAREAWKLTGRVLKIAEDVRIYVLCNYVVDLATFKKDMLCLAFNQQIEDELNRVIANHAPVANILTYARLRKDDGAQMDPRYIDMHLDVNKIKFGNDTDHIDVSCSIAISHQQEPSFTTQDTDTYLLGPYTAVFDPSKTTDNIVASPEFATHVVNGILQGKNVVIAAYGASGAGKTSTLIGFKDEETGIAVLVCNKVAEAVNAHHVTVHIRELDDYASVNMNMNSTSSPKSATFLLKGNVLVKAVVTDGQLGMPDDISNTIAGFLKTAFMDTRATFATPNNPESSRSHVLATFEIVYAAAAADNGTSASASAKLSFRLLDLAGFEMPFMCDNDLHIQSMHTAVRSDMSLSYKAAWDKAWARRPPAGLINPTLTGSTLGSVHDSKSFIAFCKDTTLFPREATYEPPLGNIYHLTDDAYKAAYDTLAIATTENRRRLADAISALQGIDAQSFECTSSFQCMPDADRKLAPDLAHDLLFLGNMQADPGGYHMADYVPYVGFKIDSGKKALLDDFVKFTTYKKEGVNPITNNSHGQLWYSQHRKGGFSNIGAVRKILNEVINPRTDLLDPWETQFLQSVPLPTGGVDKLRVDIGALNNAGTLPTPELHGFCRNLLKAINQVTTRRGPIETRLRPLIELLGMTLKRRNKDPPAMWKTLAAVYAAHQDHKRLSIANSHKRNFLKGQCEDRNYEGNFIRSSLTNVQTSIRNLIARTHTDIYPPYNTRCRKLSLDTLLPMRAQQRPSDDWDRLLALDDNTTFVMIAVANLTEGASMHPYVDVSGMLALGNSKDDLMDGCKALRTKLAKGVGNIHYNTILLDDRYTAWLSELIAVEALNATTSHPRDDLNLVFRKLTNKTAELVKLVQGSNTSSTIGVLEFLDNVAKLNTINGICRVPNVGADQVFSAGHSARVVYY